MDLKSYLESGVLDTCINGGCGDEFWLKGQRKAKPLPAEAVELIAHDFTSGDWESSELAVLLLADGSYCVAHRSTDATFAYGDIEYASTLEELCRLHMDEDQRQRLGFDVFGNRT